MKMHNDIKNHVLRIAKEGYRLDGRKFDEYRKVTVETGMIATAEGSAKVTIGDTVVITGVKMQVETPYADNPDTGNLMVGAEFLPLSSPKFESGPPGIDAIELARVVDRGIREAKAIDSKKLCITYGEKVWSVSVDVCTLNSSGNLFDAAALSAILAIKDAVFPEYKDGKLDYKKKTKQRLPIDKYPIAVTVYKIGDNYYVDPSDEEEEFVDSRLTVTSIEDGTVCALQKGGSSPISIEDIDQMTEIAIRKAKELRKFIDG